MRVPSMFADIPIWIAGVVAFNVIVLVTLV